MEYYRRKLELRLLAARSAIHLGAGGRDPATLVSADLKEVRIYGLDPSFSSLSRNPNPLRIVARGHVVPLPSESVDLIFSENVMEHVENPLATLEEAFRLLRPGGLILWVAPSLWSYSGLATHCTPLPFHRLVNRLLESVTPRRASRDVFPTYFRINSPSRVRRLVRLAGLNLIELSTFADAPHYTQFLPLIHQLAVLWHVVLDRFEFLAPLRLVTLVEARKPALSPAPTSKVSCAPSLAPQASQPADTA